MSLAVFRSLRGLLSLPLHSPGATDWLAAPGRCVPPQLTRHRRRVAPDLAGDLTHTDILNTQQRDLLSLGERQIPCRGTPPSREAMRVMSWEAHSAAMSSNRLTLDACPQSTPRLLPGTRCPWPARWTSPEGGLARHVHPMKAVAHHQDQPPQHPSGSHPATLLAHPLMQQVLMRVQLNGSLSHRPVSIDEPTRRPRRKPMRWTSFNDLRRS